MPMKQFLLVLTLLFLLISCNNLELQELNAESENNTVYYSISEALAPADRLMAKIYPETRTSGIRNISSVEIYSNDKTTRSESNDPTLFYIVNYQDNKGFAVVGANKWNEGVYAISDEGKLQVNDTISNPGLAIFFDRLNIISPDPMIPNPPGPGILPKDPFYDIDVSTWMTPVITTPVCRWSQLDPYNFYIGDIKDEETGAYKKPYAGCDPVAFAILFSYYEWPKYYCHQNYNWEWMKKSNNSYDIKNEGTAMLIADLGLPQNFEVEYRIDEKGSRSVSNNAFRTLTNFNYKHGGAYQDYSAGSLYQFLTKNSKPVVIRGTKEDGNGHAWVIDGFYNDCHKTNQIAEGAMYYGDGLLFHMIWGHSGNQNGYFKFDTTLLPYPEYNDSTHYPYYDNKTWGI